MSTASSSIEWTDRTWNPVRGCSLISPGCTHCYAMKQAHRFSGKGQPFEGLTRLTNHGPVWTGKVRLIGDALTEPLTWRKPVRVFVNSMSDLFHEGLSDADIDDVFGVMAAAAHHDFQVLTKRAARMRAYLTQDDLPFRVTKARDAALVAHEHREEEVWNVVPGFERYEASSHGRIRTGTTVLQPYLNKHESIGRWSVTLSMNGEPTTMFVHRVVLLAHRGPPPSGLESCHRNGNKLDNRLANLRWGTRSENQKEKVGHGSRGGGQEKLTMSRANAIRASRISGETQQSIADRYGISRSLVSLIENDRAWAGAGVVWPLPNVWLGVSVEDQERANERIPELLATPTALRFVSYEPALGPVDFTHIALEDGWCLNALSASAYTAGPVGTSRLIKPHPALDWVIVGGESGSNARPFSAEWARDVIKACRASEVACFVKQLGGNVECNGIQDAGDWWPNDPHLEDTGRGVFRLRLRDRKGGDMSEWKPSLRVREFPR